ncbi:MAG: PQQ-binding-like beta-propeller repeat protein [Bryobacteraceae bacterium]
MKPRTYFFTAAVLVTFSLSAGAEDWPQWRGPGRTGLSQETGLLKEWPKAGPKMLWHLTDIGEGYATPSVVGGRLYMLSNRGMDNEFVQALSVEDGKQLWSTRVGKVGNPDQEPHYPMARSTPTTDGELLYALGSDGDLVCLETATGKLRWQKSLRADFGGVPGQWAYAESPLVDGDQVIVTPSGKEAAMVALNKKTGALIWKSAVPGGDPAAYSSAMVVEAAGHRQYVQFVNKGVVGVDAKTGTFLWRYDRTGKSVAANMPTPVVRDSYVYTIAQHIGGGLIHLVPNGQGVNAEEVYFTRGLPNAVGGSVLLGDTLYGANEVEYVAADFLTGKIKWHEEGIGAGSTFYADGLLFVHGENGDVALVSAAEDGYHEHGRFSPPGQPKHVGGREKAWAYPVVAGGRLYIRDLQNLWCYDVKAK